VTEPLAAPALSGRPLTFAHRGGAALWPENTLEAFRGAIALGCSHIETDLRVTRDHQIVLFHDARLERTTNGAGLVAEHTLEQLKALDAAHHFSPEGSGFPARGRGIQVPSFEELVALAPGMRFNVEIKEYGPDAAPLPQLLWDFIRRHQLEDRIIVAAEKHPLINRFRRLSQGRVVTSASRRECVKFWLASRLGLARALNCTYQALQVPVSVGSMRFLTPRLLDAARQRGIAVHVWTIDDVTEMQQLLGMDVDGLMSDRPDRLMQVVGAGSHGQLHKEPR
jgi:glycerophosphoryl diester phosphodiesterase